MGSLMYQVMSCAALMSMGMYNLISTTRNYLKSPQNYTAKPYHPFPYPRRLQLYLIIISLIIGIGHQVMISGDADPLVKGATPVHLITSLQTAAILFLFLILSLTLLLSDISPSFLPIPTDLFFAIASPLFLLHSSLASSRSSLQTSVIEAKCLTLSSHLSSLSALLSLLLASFPRLFPADAALSSLFCLRALWALQTGLSLYADSFIPDGCHRLLDVKTGVEGSTQCDLDESKFRAVAILDLAFLIHSIFVFFIFLITFSLVAKSLGVRRLGSYEALPTAASPTDLSHTHIQMKALTGTQA